MSLSSFQQYAFIGLGSNLSSEFGAPQDNVLKAIERLKKLSADPLLVSTFIESKPLDCPPGSPDFVNAVVALAPRENINPVSFLHELQHIENRMGRVRNGLINEARIIDLDLLTFKEVIYRTDELSLPHPEILKRNFVMEPLQDLLAKDAFDRFIAFIKKPRL